MQSTPLCVIAFDIGIRNLAWCCLAQTNQKPTIRGWQNYDLLTGASAGAPAAAKAKCSSCNVAAKFTGPGGTLSCQRHCPASHPPLRDLSGAAIYKRIPPLPALRAQAEAAGFPTKRATRATLLQLLSGRFSLPLEQVKLKKAIETDLIRIHDAIRSFVQEQLPLFRQATHILLENQPVLKNPTMKSVQILLFATLRDMLQPSPPSLHLVHAGKKITGMTTGDAGYASRKDAAEAKVRSLLAAGKVVGAEEWSTFFGAQAKQSDLADAFCMVWDMHEKHPVAALAAEAPNGVETASEEANAA